MCQLLGLCSNKPVDIRFSIREFQRRGEENPHGFGFLFYEKKRMLKPVLIKKPVPLTGENVTQNPYFFESKIIIGHVRLASCGRVAHENTHPFMMDSWGFAHNGTVTSVKKWKLNKYVPSGDTDSEHAFLYLLEKLQKANTLQEQRKIIKSESEKICKLGNFNFLLSDGEYLYAFGDTSLYYVKRRAPFMEVTLKDDGYTLNLNEIKAPDEKVILIATEPLTVEERWEKISGLMVFKNGDIVDE